MKLIATALPDVKIIEPDLFYDERGYFLETWNAATFAAFGLESAFVQDNHSHSAQATLRGLHYQIKKAQGKLARVTQGSVISVAVDLRRRSTTFGKHAKIELSNDNKRMLWIPPGFAHGFYVTSPSADFSYKATEYYAPQYERTILWNDPELEIDWALLPDKSTLLSAKDINGLTLSRAEVFED